MKDLRDYSDPDLLKSLEAEIAKALAEVRTARGDLEKINSRLRFALTVVHILKEKEED
jgi:hypothetical protein